MQRYKQKEIAKEIGVWTSTISRELKRNSVQKNKRKAITKPIKKYIREKLKLDGSPEQITGWIKVDKNLTIHHETIYKFIYTNKSNNGRLYLHLRHKKEGI